MFMLGAACLLLCLLVVVCFYVCWWWSAECLLLPIYLWVRAGALSQCEHKSRPLDVFMPFSYWVNKS